MARLRDGLAATRFVRERSGQDLVEYALLAALLGTVAAASLPTIEAAISTGYSLWNSRTQDLWVPPEPVRGHEVPVSMTISFASQLALLVAGLAAALDLRTKRIPNVLTFGGALCACLLQLSTGGSRGLALAVAGWIVGVAIFLPFFMLGGMGAGDVKLVGAIGACLGPAGALYVALGSAIAGGVLAVLVTLRNGYFGTSVANLRRLIVFWRTNGLTPMPDLTLTSGSGPRLAYAVPILIGTLGALWVR